jgi:ABC-2 type transport system permease protein
VRRPATFPGPFRQALHAEWTKIRTVPGTPWLLAAVVAGTVAVAFAATSVVTCPAAGCGQDPARISLTGVEFGQAAVAVLAVLAVSGEYGTGMIHVTFAAMPRRTTVLAAKATVVSALVLAAGVIAVPVSIVVGRIILPGRGFTAANGYRALSLADGPVARAAVGSVLYLVLIGLFGLGIAAAVRDAAPAIGITLALLYLFPILGTVGNPQWYRHVQQVGPMTAGLAVQATVDVPSQPVAPWIGLGVLSAWTATALVAGGLLCHFRDA